MTVSSPSLRWQVKVALASTIARARRLPIVAAAARTRRHALILGYHRIVDDFAHAARTEMPSMLTSRVTFERHLDCLAREFTFVSLDEIGARLLSGEPFDRPVAAVTFDDGYRDVYEQALPALRQRGIPAAVFVVTDLIGRPAWQVHDRLYHLLEKGFARWSDPYRALAGLLDDLRLPVREVLPTRAASRDAMSAVSSLLPALPQADVNRLAAALETEVGNGHRDIPRTLTWAMLAEMQRAGVTIGSHTCTHISMPAESPATVAAELLRSKRTLEERLGTPALHFAYPGGQFNAAAVDATRRAGYRFAYTACSHRDRRHPALTQERLLLWERSSLDERGTFHPTLLQCQAHGFWPPARRCGRRHDA